MRSVDTRRLKRDRGLVAAAAAFPFHTTPAAARVVLFRVGHYYRRRRRRRVDDDDRDDRDRDDVYAFGRRAYTPPSVRPGTLLTPT